MLERITHPYNLQKALESVERNKGAAGIDGIRYTELRKHFTQKRSTILQQIQDGNYLPQAILGKEIPKSNGKKRLLGIPTTTDRLLQQATAQVLMTMYEKEFHENSYGFRTRKNAHGAISKAMEYIHSGKQWIVDIDLKNFFDEVNHCLLLNLLYQKVRCNKTMKLIRSWLRAPISIGGKLHKRRKGIPQGSPLSPLLANILLNEFDKEMTRRGFSFVRYADDFSIYTESEMKAKMIKGTVTKFLTKKLDLPINQEKSGIRRPSTFSMLGFRFVPFYEKKTKGTYQLTVSEKGWDKLKQTLKELTRKTSPITLSERLRKIKEVQRGWITYFRGTNIYGRLREFDGWLRNRLRLCIWKNWKKPERKRKNLIRLGVPPDQAYAWSRTRLGTWRIAQSPILTTTITLKRLKQKGYESMLEVYLKLNPSFYQPRST